MEDLFSVFQWKKNDIIIENEDEGGSIIVFKDENEIYNY